MFHTHMLHTLSTVTLEHIKTELQEYLEEVKLKEPEPAIPLVEIQESIDAVVLALEDLQAQ